MKTHPYIIQEKQDGSQLAEVLSSERHFDEAWLQELLRLHPNILPTAEIETVFSSLVPIGREVTTGVGSIDILFISHSGYLVLVETKLWRNPEAKREVLAQAIDYSASLSKFSFGELDKVVRNYTATFEGKETGLVDWVEYNLGPFQVGREYFEDTVMQNLRLGRFLTLIVGDRIRQSLLDMMSYVNKYPHLSMNVALVELPCYRLRKDKDWPLLFIPNLISRTEIVERSVVQVTVTSQGQYSVEAVQDKADDKEKTHRREFLTEDAYWELLKQKLPNGVDKAKELVDHFRAIEGINIEPSTGSIVARLNVQDSGIQATLFFIDKNGNLYTWPDTIRGQISRGGFNPNLVDAFDRDVSQILKKGISQRSKPILLLNQDRFISIADAFIKCVQTAEYDPSQLES
jgi:hypothetical protein